MTDVVYPYEHYDVGRQIWRSSVWSRSNGQRGGRPKEGSRCIRDGFNQSLAPFKASSRLSNIRVGTGNHVRSASTLAAVTSSPMGIQPALLRGL